MLHVYKDSGLDWTRKARNLPSIKTNVSPMQCTKPWHDMQIDKNGFVYICGCNGWLPYPVGKVLDFETIEEVYQSHNAKIIQKTIIDGTYEFCDTEHCPVRNDNCVTTHMVGQSYFIEVGIDESCNLACPSCRRNVIFHDANEIYNERLLWVQRLEQWIAKSPDKNFLLNMGSDGEPFASPLYLHLLKNRFVYNNVSYNIRTNGTLIKRHISSLELLPKLQYIELSIDAASKEVYENVRRPGKWNNLQENVDYLLQVQKSYNFKVGATFVIQKSNINDVLNFIDWCTERQIIPNFHLIQNWASFDNFDEQCVHRPQDALYSKFIEIINNPKFTKLNVGWSQDYKIG